MVEISMGSMGFLLADWSIELIRYRQQHFKVNSKAKLEKNSNEKLCIKCVLGQEKEKPRRKVRKM